MRFGISKVFPKPVDPPRVTYPDPSKPANKNTRIESDEIYQLRRRVSDLEDRQRDTEMMVQLLYNTRPPDRVESWKGDDDGN